MVISNNIGNEVSSRIIVAPITSSITKKAPFDVTGSLHGTPCKVLVSQLRCIDKQRLGKKIDTCDSATLVAVEEALKVVFDLP